MALHNAHVIEWLQSEKCWYDQSMEADHWNTMGDITPNQAAMLLCRFNPNAQSLEEANLWTTDELGPEHFVRLEQRLADINRAEPRPHTLRDWHQTAQALGLTYHSWIDRYMEATAPPGQPEPAVHTIKPGPLEADSASFKRRNRKMWTPEKLGELGAYRATHTMSETAAKFGISEQRIRKLLPRDKPKASLFPWVMHRQK